MDDTMDDATWIWISGIVGTVTTAMGATLPRVLSYLDRRAARRLAIQLAEAGMSPAQIRRTLEAATPTEGTPRVDS